MPVEGAKMMRIVNYWKGGWWNADKGQACRREDGMRCHLLMDADDTLWENNIYFEQAIEAFITLLDHRRLSRQEVRAELDEVERSMGYGSANFTRSLLETYRRLAGDVEQVPLGDDIRRLGESILDLPIQLMEGVKETLDYLSARHDLVLLTKGDLEEQKLKIERSGIKAYFRQAIIVQEKDAAAYRRLVGELQVDPQQTWMVGNSPRSDINPALAAGLKAVYIPHPHTWRLEHEEVQESGEGRVLRLASFAELRGYF
jgi:putative hydrolase of the HAD superfamily